MARAQFELKTSNVPPPTVSAQTCHATGTDSKLFITAEKLHTFQDNTQ